MFPSSNRAEKASELINTIQITQGAIIKINVLFQRISEYSSSILKITSESQYAILITMYYTICNMH